jgi:predicted transcriptional regulator
LPSEIKEGLRKIARLENKSMSWVMEQVIIRYFHMKQPRYVVAVRKKTTLKLVASGRR